MVYKMLKILPFILCLAWLIMPAVYSQIDPNIDESGNTPNVEKKVSDVEIINPFIKTSSIFVEVLLFVVLTAIVYGAIFMWFKNSVEADNSPLEAYFSSTSILLLAMLIFAFICFGEHTYRIKEPVSGIAGHFRSINWIPWLLIFVLIIILIIISKGRASGSKSKTSS